MTNVDPDLEVWLPRMKDQLLANWNCCIRSMSGQLQLLYSE